MARWATLPQSVLQRKLLLHPCSRLKRAHQTCDIFDIRSTALCLPAEAHIPDLGDTLPAEQHIVGLQVQVQHAAAAK